MQGPNVNGESSAESDSSSEEDVDNRENDAESVGQAEAHVADKQEINNIIKGEEQVGNLTF